jgi:transcriptional regulator with XRE-family HTH domain
MVRQTNRRPRANHAADYRAMLVRLRLAREAVGLRQVDVGRVLGRPNSFVSKCELGERRIDPIELRDFARIYRKPLGYFIP